ncbi:MAG: sulfatase [Verrucomicrobiales bacterium]|nr:sulfatase [Verrucomicrobiales bacterium]
MRSFFLSLSVLFLAAVTLRAEPLNLLIITVDDMSCDSIGAYGCPVPDTTPNIDKLASESFMFRRAHVVVGNCFPSRNVMWSGLYPHHSGVEGFYQVPDAQHDHLVDVVKRAGYFTAIRGKVSHSTPYSPYAWDLNLDTLPDGTKPHIKDAASYGASTVQGIEAARAAGQPFCLMINVSDPHKPFYGEVKGGNDPHVPSHVFTPEEVAVPGFLFDDPVVREELARYYSSVRRADDAVFQILKTLEDMAEKDSTVVLFLSDHGMPLPFAKTQVYHHSTRTPLMVRWPDVTKPGAEDDAHMVSAVDILPSLVEILGIDPPKNKMDGHSFVPILLGEKQADRDFVIKEYNENAGASRDPMRAVQTQDLLYIFNPWSNGERVFATATNGTDTYRRMKALAEEGDSVLAARHELYQHRVPEELYQISTDPDCLHNLIDDPKYASQLADLRRKLGQWMKDSGDHCLEAFEHRDDPAAMEAYVQRKEAESDARRAAKSKGGKKGAPQAKIFRFPTPESVVPGQAVTLTIPFELPENLSETQLCVSLKEGDKKGRRLDRETLILTGSGKTEVTLDVPADLSTDQVVFAAWAGPDFERSLQYVQKAAAVKK